MDRFIPQATRVALRRTRKVDAVENERDVDVVVVGAGPVGLFLGGLLGRQGISTVVVERNPEASHQAKIMSTSARSMEFLRHLGLADKFYDWGFPADWPMHNVWVTSLDGFELGRANAAPIGQPGSVGVSEFSPESQSRCPQPWLERILEAHLVEQDDAVLRRRTEFESFVEYDDAVVATVRDLKTDEKRDIRARYLVSCEGVEGKVASALGIPVSDRTIDYSHDVEFLCDDLLAEHDKGPAWRYTLVDASGTWGTLVAVDGRSRWRLSIYNLGREGANSVVLRDSIVRAIGHEFDFEILHSGRWKRRAALAASYGRGRVFLAGDSAHANPPNGGFGMNTGFADAVNLGWKLRAALDGWAGPDLLPSYGQERRPIAQLTLAEAVRNYQRIVGELKFDDIVDDTVSGAEHRRQVGEEAVAEGLKAWRPLGIHFGYGYPWSSIVDCEPGNYPEIDLQGYAPSTDPGFRAPHAWLADGSSTLDLFGDEHVLLRVGAGGPQGEAILEAAKAVGVPMTAHSIAGPAVEAVYDHALIIVRPDGHVAWRSHFDPADAATVVDRLRGFVGGTVARFPFPDRRNAIRD